MKWMWVLLLAVAGCASAPWPRRTVQQEWTSLDVPWFELEAPAGRQPVTVIGVVHVAEPSFWAAVQDATNRCSLVLAEGITRSPTAPAAASPLEAYAKELKRAATTLKLVLQSEGLKPRSWWTVTDLSESEFLRDADAEGLIEEMRIEADTLERTLNRDDALAEFAKRVMAIPYDDRYLLSRRNDVALRALDAAHPEGRIGILFGALHVPDLVTKLEARGYVVTRVKWVTVYAYRTPAELRTDTFLRPWRQSGPAPAPAPRR